MRRPRHGSSGSLAATVFAACVALLVACPVASQAAADIGPPLGACGGSPPPPYPAIHANCVRVSNLATIAVDQANVTDGSTLTLTFTLNAPVCARVSPTPPCIDYIEWDIGGDTCVPGYRLVANDRTFFTSLGSVATYYHPFSFHLENRCIIGTVSPNDVLQRVVSIHATPGVGPIPPSWLVMTPAIRYRETATFSRTIYVEAVTRLDPAVTQNAPPSASFSWEAQDDDPLAIDFDGSGSNDDKAVTRWEWDFDDGATASGETAQHTFEEAGTYHVRLTVFDQEGLSSTTTRDVVIEGHSIELTLDAATPQGQGVERTQRIVYTLDAQPDERADEMTVSATVPTDFVEVDESTIPGGGVLSPDGKTVEWTLTNTSGTDPPLSFAVTVRADVPRSVLFISTEAHAHATFGDEEASTSTLRQTPLVQFGLVLTGEIASERGDHVVPGQTATVRVQADAREQADELVLVASVPKSSNLVAGSISDNGAREGERTIRWRFTNVTQTPIVHFDIKVDALKDIPKDLKKLSAKTTAQATFGAIPEAAENTLEIAIVRPTTIRGVVHDIVQGTPSRLRVTTPTGGAGTQIRLSELLSGQIVDHAVTSADGSFSVEAGKPMGYLLEAFTTVPMKTRGGASQLVRSKHVIEVRDNGEVYVDNRLAPTTGDGTPAPLDVYVPVSLVQQADALITSLGSTQIEYWLVMKLDIAPILDFLNSLGIPFTNVRFDTNEATSVLDAAVDMRGTQIRTDGYPAHFNGLYEPGNPATERDGWNGLVRLNAMLAQLGAVKSDPKRLGDALTIIRPIALAIALQVTTTVVKMIGKKLKTPRAGAKWRFYRIAFMSDVVGFAAPYAIDIANWAGGRLDKAKWMEWFAKGSRYGMDIMMGFLEKGAKWWTLFDDLTFEAIFNAVRVGVTGIMLDGWINLMAQKSLDEVGFLDSTFAGSSSAIDQYVANADSRLSSGVFSAGNLQKLSTIESNVVSTIRTLDGFMATWKGAYGSKTPPSIPKIQALQTWLDTKFAGSGGAEAAFQRWVLILNALAIETGVVGLEALGLEVQNIAGALTVGPPSSARKVSPASTSVPAAPSTARAISSPTAGTAWSPRALRAGMTAYGRAATRLAAALVHPERARRAERRAFEHAATRLVVALEPAIRRALLAESNVSGTGGQRVTAFVDTSRELADAELTVSELLAGDAEVDGGAARTALRRLAARAGALRRALTAATPALSRRAPGSLMTTPADVTLPSDGAILSGKAFDARVTFWNPGDTPAAPASVELTPADGLDLVSRAVAAVPRLRPGAKVTLTWRLKASAARRMLASHAQLSVTRGDRVAANVDVPIFAFATTPSG